MRVVVWLLHVALPVGGLFLLLRRPAMDMSWRNPTAHFWLVLVVAAVNVGLGLAVGAAARRRADARLVLVALAFIASAGFLAAHALATPGVLVAHPNAGFDLAQPVGLAVAAVFVFASALRLGSAGAARVVRAAPGLYLLVALAVATWVVASLTGLAALRQPVPDRTASSALDVAAVVAIGLYLAAALRYYLSHRRAPAAMLLSLVTAFVLLAEAMTAVMLAPNWHLSWWEWHVLLTFGFGFVAYSAYVQYRREGGGAGIFDAITLSQTALRIRSEYGTALEEYVTALGEQERTGQPAALAARVADRFGLTEGQAAVLDRAGFALATERRLSMRLSALVDVAELARIAVQEPEFLAASQQRLTAAFGPVRLTVISDGVLRIDDRRYDPAQLSTGTPVQRDGRLAYPLTVKGLVTGVLEVDAQAAGENPDQAVLATLASQLSIALENGRLYRELGTLFRQYLSPDVAAALLADPDQAALGGSVVEVTALFADLRGFTSFSEGVAPAEIVGMLNRYHGVAVPAILRHGGTVVQFVGDALLALFNAPARQSDHARRAVAAALDMQAEVEQIASTQPGWPRFRIGANTGPALVGNIGSEDLRGFNAMGDAVNVAARLQALAEPGQVVIGESTRLQLDGGAVVTPLGELQVKGRQAAVRAYVVTRLSSPAGSTADPP